MPDRSDGRKNKDQAEHASQSGENKTRVHFYAPHLLALRLNLGRPFNSGQTVFAYKMCHQPGNRLCCLYSFQPRRAAHQSNAQPLLLCHLYLIVPGQSRPTFCPTRNTRLPAPSRFIVAMHQTDDATTDSAIALTAASCFTEIASWGSAARCKSIMAVSAGICASCGRTAIHLHHSDCGQLLWEPGPEDDIVKTS